MKKILSKFLYLINKYFTYRKYFSLYKTFKEFTMIDTNTYVGNLKLASKYKNENGVVVECGVWKGGMIAGIAKILGNNFNYYLFDSFEGLPNAKEIDGKNALLWQSDIGSEFYFDNCKISMELCDKAMKKAEIINYQIKKGWFSDSLLSFNEEITILRLDGDWYESTYICLKYLFPKVIKNGIIIIDDYYMWDGCSKAVHDYLSETKSPNRIRMTKEGICYILKES